MNIPSRKKEAAISQDTPTPPSGVGKVTTPPDPSIRASYTNLAPFASEVYSAIEEMEERMIGEVAEIREAVYATASDTNGDVPKNLEVMLRTITMGTEETHAAIRQIVKTIDEMSQILKGLVKDLNDSKEASKERVDDAISSFLTEVDTPRNNTPGARPKNQPKPRPAIGGIRRCVSTVPPKRHSSSDL